MITQGTRAGVAIVRFELDGVTGVLVVRVEIVPDLSDRSVAPEHRAFPDLETALSYLEDRLGRWVTQR